MLWSNVLLDIKTILQKGDTAPPGVFICVYMCVCLWMFLCIYVYVSGYVKMFLFFFFKNPLS